MDLSNDLISKFVKITGNQSNNKSKEGTAYGTIVEFENKMYVKLDGSDLLTPINSTSDVKDGERVTIMIKDHNAVVTGNITSPSASSGDVKKVTQEVTTLGGEIAEFETIVAKKVGVDELDAEVARINDLIAGRATIEDLNATNAEIVNLQAKDAEIVNLVAGKAEIGDLTATNAEIENLKAKDAEITSLVAGKANISDLTAINADIVNLKAKDIETDNLLADKASIGELNAVNANIDILDAEVAEITSLVAGKANISDLTATNAEIENLKAKDIETDNLIANKASIGELNAVNANIDILDAEVAEITSLVAGKANISDLTAINADIVDLKAKDIETDNLLADKASIRELNAVNANIDILDAEVADIQTLVSGNLTSDNIASLNLTSANTTIQNAMIKDAMIDSVTASKIKSGTIDTNLVTIQSTDGSMILTGSVQQFKDENGVTRIQIGKDTGGNFTFILYDENGTGVLIDEDGIKSSNAIADGLIVDSKVADNANIAGSKLDIASVITEVNNDDSTTIKSNKIYLDEQGQSLEVAFNSLKTQVETIQDVTIDGDLTSIVEQVQSNTTKIEVNKEGISALVAENTIRKEEIQNLDGEIESVNNTLSSKYSSLEQDVSGFKTTVADTYTTKSEFNNLQIGGRNLATLSNIQEYIGGRLSNNRYYSVEGTKIIAKNQPLTSSVIGFKIYTDNAFEYVVSGYTDTSLAYVFFTCYDENDTVVQSQRTHYKDVVDGKFILSFNNIPKDTYYLHIGIGDVNTANYFIDKLKIEKGNKATDYTPAPEDIQGQIDATNNNLANNYSTTSAMNSAIQQKANEITSSVSETYTTKSEFNNLEVGGANLVYNGGFNRNLDGWNVNGGSCGVQACTESPSGYMLCMDVTGYGQGVYQYFTFHDNTYCTDYVVSFYAKSNVDGLQMYASMEWDPATNTVFTLNGGWQKCVYKFRRSNPGSNALVFYSNGVGTGSIYIHSIKMEKGTVPSAWSPHPSEIDNKVNDLSNNLANNYSTTSAMNSAIQQKANEITSSVSQTYTTKSEFNNLSNNLANNYSTTSAMNSAIQQKANEITSSVSQTYTTKSEFNNLEVGGRNLLVGLYDNRVSSGSKGEQSFFDIWNWSISGLTEQNYVISFEARADSPINVMCYFYEPSNTTYAESSTGQKSNAGDGAVEVTLTTEWKRYWVRWQHPGCEGTKHLLLGRNYTDTTAYIRKVKFEKGSKATDWSPAPEDVQGQIDATNANLQNNYSTTSQMNSAIQQKANEITSSVSQSYISNYEAKKLADTTTTGLNKYLFERYRRDGFDYGTRPTLNDLVGARLIVSQLVDSPPAHTSDLDNNYIGVLTFYLYYDYACTKTVTVTTDDNGTVYLNNVGIYELSSCQPANVTFNMIKGLNRIDIIYAEGGGGDGVSWGGVDGWSAFGAYANVVTNEIANRTNELTLAMTQGNMLYTDPTFRNNDNSTFVYNNLGNNTVSRERIAAIEGCPNTSGYCMKITTNGEATPGLGGFAFGNYCRYNAVFITKITAKIPVGYSIVWASNAVGDNGEQKWLSSTAGTGDWYDYYCKVKCGDHGSISNTNYFYLVGPQASAENPVTWYVSYATVFDVTDSDERLTNLTNNLATNYSTTTQMNSAIQQKANEITSSVSQTYTTKSEFNNLSNNLANNYSTTVQMNSAIQQKANEITSSVSQTYITKSETSLINDTVAGNRKWLFERYTNNQLAGNGGGNYPTLAHLANETLMESRLVDTLPGTSANIGDYYIGVYTVYLYYESAYTWSGTITSDDESTTYLNGVVVCQAQTCTSTPFTMNFKKGINKLQIIHGEGGGGDGVSLSDLGPWKEYGAYPACVTAASSNHYASNSDIVQTVNDLTIKFTESGGYNLLQNGHADKGTNYWVDNGGGLGLAGGAGGGAMGNFFTTSLPQGISYYHWVRLLPNTHYVYQAKVWSNVAFNGNGSVPLHFWFSYNASDNTGEGYAVLDYQQNISTSGKWTQCYVHFVTGDNNIYFKPFIYHNGASTDIYVTELMLSQSRVVQPWSPHPSEVYSGITQIDKDGVRVQHSNFNGYTHMAPGGFFINHNGADVVALDASGLRVAGSITATSGQIAHYTINEHALVGHNVGLCGNPNYGYWALWSGSGDSGNAPFRVGHGGELYATNATISGNITASSGNIGGTTTIDGNCLVAGTVGANAIAAGSITANKLCIGDSNNYCQLTKGVTLYNRYGHALWSGSGSHYYWASSSTFLPFTVDGTRNPFKEGDIISFNLDIYCESYAGHKSIGVWFYSDDNNGEYLTECTSSVEILAGWNNYKFDVTMNHAYVKAAKTIAILAHIDSVYTEVRNVVIRRKVTGELIVDGSITADKIAADAITGKTITGSIINGGTISGTHISGTTFTSAGTEGNSNQYQTMTLNSGALMMTGAIVGGTNDGQEANRSYLTSMGLVVKDSSYNGFGGNANVMYTNTGIYWNPKTTGGEEYPNWQQLIGYYDDFVLIDRLPLRMPAEIYTSGVATGYTNLYISPASDGEVRVVDNNSSAWGNGNKMIYRPIRASEFYRNDGNRAYINTTGDGTLTSANRALVSNGIRTNASNFYIGVDDKVIVSNKNGYNDGKGITYKPITASAFQNSSDLMFKKNIRTIDDLDIIDILNKVDVYRYDVIGGDENEIGLIAQACPSDLISGTPYDMDIQTANEITDEDRQSLVDPDNCGASVNLYHMASILWKVCKEQQKRIERLEKLMKGEE